MSSNPMPTASSSKYSHATSPSLSASVSSDTHQQQKLNIVTRLALDGKAKPGWDGAAIKVYLKISLPLDTVTPGSSIPLFPEGNVKIFDSQVHPIDNLSAPYSFSSATCPLLNKAAKALNLPARSSQSYLSLFGTSSTLASSSRHSSSSTTNGANIPPLDEKYTGSILVGGYNVSFILPKVFPAKFPEDSHISAKSAGSFSRRRNSVVDKNNLQFMAAIDMWVPYLSSPPQAPYLLSIPTPRCLSNHIKLRIFPLTASTTSGGSYASLSSAEEDVTSWDLTSDPLVARTSSGRLSRSTSYNDFADDESSDAASISGAGFGDGCGLQGTFPSAERIRVRWAAPLKPGEVPEAADGRRRVGVRDVKGEMTCVILDKRREGVLVKLDYKGTCKGVWFPGVATLLGMDVNLTVPGANVSWVPGMESRWSISGSSGFTGFSPSPPMSRSGSVAEPPFVVGSPLTNGPNTNPRPRYDSSSSTASLLRAPLPAQSVDEYSFETSTSTLSAGTISSIGSLEGRSRSSSINIPENKAGSATPPPTAPVTLHLNMNDLLPPSNDTFTFSMSGVVLLSKQLQGYPGNSESELEDAEIPLFLPKFGVVYTENEIVSTIVRSEATGFIIEVFRPVGDIQEPNVRKTVLQKGATVKCGADGGRIILRPVIVTTPTRANDENKGPDESRSTRIPIRPHTPHGRPLLTRNAPNSALRQMASTLKPRREGPLMIPSVVALVTPLVLSGATLPNAYAVKVSLPAPSNGASEWLEFGLAQTIDEDRPPQVQVASASVEGVPVAFETTAAVKQEKASDGSFVPFDQMSGKEWVSWVRVHIGDLGGGRVEVVYLTKAKEKGLDIDHKKDKRRALDDTEFDVLLPTFSLPIGQLEVNIEFQSGYEISTVRSNLAHEQIFPHCRKLLHYSMDELFYPRVTVTFIPLHRRRPEADRRILPTILRFLSWTAPAVISMVLFFYVINLELELRQIKSSIEECPVPVDTAWNEPATVTFTTTILAPQPSSSLSGAKWWFTSDHPILFPPVSSTPLEPSATAADGAFVASRLSTLTSTATTTSITTIPQSSSVSIPLTDMFPWTFDFDIPPAHVITEQIRRGLTILCVVIQKFFHYPLDPP